MFDVPIVLRMKQLPVDVMARITGFLELRDVNSLMQTCSDMYLKLNSDEYWKILFFGKFSGAYYQIENHKLEYKKRQLKVFLESTRFCRLPLQDHDLIDVVRCGESFIVLLRDDLRIKLYKLARFKYSKDPFIQYDLPLISSSIQSHRHVLVNDSVHYYKKHSKIIEFDSDNEIYQVEFIDDQSEGLLFRLKSSVLLYYKGHCIAKFKSSNEILFILNSRLELFVFTGNALHIYKLDFKKLIHEFCKVYTSSISLDIGFNIESVEFNKNYYPYCIINKGQEKHVYNLITKKFITSVHGATCFSILNNYMPACCFASNRSILLYNLMSGKLLNKTQTKFDIKCMQLTSYFLLLATESHFHVLDSSNLNLKFKINIYARGNNLNDFLPSPSVHPRYILSDLDDRKLSVCIFFTNATVRFYEFGCFLQKKSKLNKSVRDTRSRELLESAGVSHRHSRETVQQLTHELWTMQYDFQIARQSEERILTYNGESGLTEEEMIELAINLSVEET
eukprot:NODE_16_length_41655_cov_0.272813.p5 type:complete len:507 gc:universal NODE_16_length_41655_cov_0.272813:2329-3849(+)